MSITFAENDFTNIFEIIDQIHTFINCQIEESLSVQLIKDLFTNTFYVERLVESLSCRGLKDIFESKLNEHRLINDKIIPLEVHLLERFCDEVMKKILMIEPPVEVITIAIEEYVRLLSSQRFEALIHQLSEFRSLFLKLTKVTQNVLPLHQVSSSFLIQSWLKLKDSEENWEQEIEIIMQGMFSDADSAQTIIGLLALESTEDVLPFQNMMLNIISEEVKCNLSSATWRSILHSDEIIVPIQKFPKIFDVISFTLEKMEEFIKYDNENKTWSLNNSDLMDFAVFINILRTLFTVSATHYKTKKFIILRKKKGHFELWTFVWNELHAISM